MKEIVIGTGNPAKKKAVQSALAPLGILVKGSDDLGLALDITEDGSTAQENARKKSLAYARAAGQPVLSIDNALYLEGLPADEQPGINTRRVPGHAGRASDEELLAHYAQKIGELGGRIDGYWEYAVCLATPDGRVFETTFLVYRKFVSQPGPNRVAGYPLESIQIEPESGKYIADMPEAEQDAFWQKGIGKQLCDFVAEAGKALAEQRLTPLSAYPRQR